MKPRCVVLETRCDSPKIAEQQEAARFAVEIFLSQLRDQIGHDVKHTIPIDGQPVVEVEDDDAIAYLSQFKLLIVQSVTKLHATKK